MFWNRKKKPEIEPTVFIEPQDFASNLDLFIRICQFSFCSDLFIYAYREDSEKHRKGDIEMYIYDITEFRELLETCLPGVYNYVYNTPDYKKTPGGHYNDSRYLRFHEPECFLFHCSQEDFLNRAKKIAPNSYTWKYWTISDPMQIWLTCSEVSFDDRMWCLKQFEKYVKKHMMR